MTLSNDSLLFKDLTPAAEVPSKRDEVSVPSKKTTSSAPLSFLLSPASLEDYVGQDHLLSEGKPIRALLKHDRLLSMILWGPPGCGKTSLAKLMSTLTQAHFISLNAVTAKIQDIKDASKMAASLRPKKTVLFIDEIHRFSKTQQDALLPSVENGLLTLIGATTENPFFSVIPPLVSRSKVYELFPLSTEHLKQLLEKGIRFLDTQGQPLDFEEDAKMLMLNYCQGDARKLLTLLEWVSHSLGKESSNVTKETIQVLTQTKGVSHNIDAHYDLISALIKSIRGSDVDASVYWLARCLKGGEDPSFITRRLIILASEDIGNANPTALLMATSLLNVVHFIGLPEAQINLSHVVTYLAKSPKSNAAYMAIKRANALIDSGQVYPVPNHLKDSHYKGAQRMGFGEGYKYPHDFPGNTVDQLYWDGKESLYRD